MFFNRNAKNRPSKYGEIYGDNLNSVAEVAHSVGTTKISMDGHAVAADRKHFRKLASMRSHDDTAMMGIEEDGVVMDVDVIRRLKLDGDRKFRVSVDEKTYDYVLDGGNIRYRIPMDTDYDNRTFPDVSGLEGNETGRPFDTSVIEKLYKDAKKANREYGDVTPMEDMGVFLVSDPNGVTAQLVDGTDYPLGQPYVLSREGTEKEYLARYKLDELRSFVAANPTGRLNFGNDESAIFTWDDPAYKGRVMVAPCIKDPWERTQMDGYRREWAQQHHREALASSNRRRNPRRRRRCQRNRESWKDGCPRPSPRPTAQRLRACHPQKAATSYGVAHLAAYKQQRPACI